MGIEFGITDADGLPAHKLVWFYLASLARFATKAAVYFGLSMRDVAIHSPTFSFPLSPLANYLRGSFRRFLFHSRLHNRVYDCPVASGFP
jgi:hypothetical protein